MFLLPSPHPLPSRQALPYKKFAAVAKLRNVPLVGLAKLREHRLRARPTIAVAAGEGSNSASESWLDCDVRFTALEARAKEMERTEADMTQAAKDMNFERAQSLKVRLAQLKSASADTSKAPPAEKWLLKAGEFAAFGNFLSSRGVSPKGVDIACDQESDAAWGDRKCEECLKLNSGGPYGAVGVAVAAYPPQELASGCLGLSGALDVDTSEYDGLGRGVLGDDSWDSTSAPTRFGFCRVPVP